MTLLEMVQQALAPVLPGNEVLDAQTEWGISPLGDYPDVKLCVVLEKSPPQDLSASHAALSKVIVRLFGGINFSYSTAVHIVQPHVEDVAEHADLYRMMDGKAGNVSAEMANSAFRAGVIAACDELLQANLTYQQAVEHALAGRIMVRRAWGGRLQLRKSNRDHAVVGIYDQHGIRHDSSSDDHRAHDWTFLENAR